MKYLPLLWCCALMQASDAGAQRIAIHDQLTTCELMMTIDRKDDELVVHCRTLDSIDRRVWKNPVFEALMERESMMWKQGGDMTTPVHRALYDSIKAVRMQYACFTIDSIVLQRQQNPAYFQLADSVFSAPLSRFHDTAVENRMGIYAGWGMRLHTDVRLPGGTFRTKVLELAAPEIYRLVVGGMNVLQRDPLYFFPPKKKAVSRN